MDAEKNIKVPRPPKISTKGYILCEPYMAIRYGLRAGIVWAALVQFSNERDEGFGFQISYDELAIRTGTVVVGTCKQICSLLKADGWLEDKRSQLYYPKFRIARIPPKVSMNINDKRLTKVGKRIGIGRQGGKTGIGQADRQRRLNNKIKQIKEEIQEDGA